MSTIIQLPQVLAVHRSIGNVDLNIALDKSAQISPVLTFTDQTGKVHVVEVTREECATLAESLIAFCTADERQLEVWRLELEFAI